MAQGLLNIRIEMERMRHLAATVQKKEAPMTQELVLGVLLTGIVGMLWVMTISILSADHPASKAETRELAREQADGRSA